MTADIPESPIGPVELGDGTTLQFDWRSRVPSTAIVQTVAAATDRDAAAMPPLRARIEPDAIDRLFAEDGSVSGPADLRLSFFYDGHEVTVRESGEVTVR